MKTYHVEFEVIPGNYGGKEGPYEARVWIELKSYSKGKERTIFASSECRNKLDWEPEVDRLVKELGKSIRQQLKKIFDLDEKRFQNSLKVGARIN